MPVHAEHDIVMADLSVSLSITLWYWPHTQYQKQQPNFAPWSNYMWRKFYMACGLFVVANLLGNCYSNS